MKPTPKPPAPKPKLEEPVAIQTSQYADRPGLIQDSLEHIKTALAMMTAASNQEKNWIIQKDKLEAENKQLSTEIQKLVTAQKELKDKIYEHLACINSLTAG